MSTLLDPGRQPAGPTSDNSGNLAERPTNSLAALQPWEMSSGRRKPVRTRASRKRRTAAFVVAQLPAMVVMAFLAYVMIAPQQAMNAYQAVARKVIVDRMVENIAKGVPPPAPTQPQAPPTPR